MKICNISILGKLVSMLTNRLNPVIKTRKGIIAKKNLDKEI